MENKNTNKTKKSKALTKKIREFWGSRKAKHGAIASGIIAVAVILAILVNVAIGLLVQRFPNIQIDLTSAKTYQLQEDTVDFISQLDSPVTVYILANEKTFKSGLNAYSGAYYFVQAEKLLTKADALSDNFTIKYIDLSDNPTFSSKYPNINWTSTTESYLMLIECGENYTALTVDELFTYDADTYSYYGYYAWTGSTIEQGMVTGILYVTTDEKTKVQFITGSGQDNAIYSSLMTTLKQNAYDVSEVSLTTETLADDTKIAISYGPTVDLSKEATEKLKKWLENDGNYGRTLIYLPIDQQGDMPNIEGLIEDYGMEIADSLAFSTDSSYVMNSPYMFLADYADDEYTATLKNATIPTVTYNNRPIEILDEASATPLLNITSSAGALPFDADTSKYESEKEFQKLMKPDGITLAAIGKKTNSDDISSNVVVFGSYSMFYPDFLSATSYNNANYFINLCNTITNRGDMGITITSASNENIELGVTDSDIVVTVGVVFIGLVPLVVLLAGLFVFIRRRNS